MAPYHKLWLASEVTFVSSRTCMYLFLRRHDSWSVSNYRMKNRSFSKIAWLGFFHSSGASCFSLARIYFGDLFPSFRLIICSDFLSTPHRFPFQSVTQFLYKSLSFFLPVSLSLSPSIPSLSRVRLRILLLSIRFRIFILLLFYFLALFSVHSSKRIKCHIFRCHGYKWKFSSVSFSVGFWVYFA